MYAHDLIRSTHTLTQVKHGDSQVKPIAHDAQHRMLMHSRSRHDMMHSRNRHDMSRATSETLDMLQEAMASRHSLSSPKSTIHTP
jgi:hypothetical protein